MCVCVCVRARACVRVHVCDGEVLTDYVQHVGVVQTAVLVLHHTGVAASVGRTHRLKGQRPRLLQHLRGSRERSEHEKVAGLNPPFTLVV